MASPSLVEPLRGFCLDAAALLTRAVREGVELPFDLVEERGRGGSLYHYRPRTAEFVGDRWPELSALETFLPALRAVGPAAEAYARTHALVDSEPIGIVRHVLERLYEDAGDFGFPEQRFDSICAELHQDATEGIVRAVVIARLRGVHLASAAVELDDQLALAGGHAVHELPPGLLDDDGARSLPEVVCVYAAAQQAADPLPLADANARFGRLLTGLRLMGATGARIDPVAWARAGHGPWLAAPVDAGTRARREEWRLAADQEDELADLLDLLSRSRRSGRLGLALGRFEMGCARALAGEALVDHMLGLRALVEGGRSDDARLAPRVAALCAEGDERDDVQTSIAQALVIEAQLLDGHEPEPGATLDAVSDLEQHLRALLRDRLCGYLEDDLAAAADERLAEAGAEGEIDAYDTRELGEEEAPILDDDDERARREQVAALETQELMAVVPEAELDEGDDAEYYAGPV